MAESFPYWVENNVGKGEIARYKQFLLFPRVFKRHVLQARKNQGLFGKGLMLVTDTITILLSQSC